MYIHMYMYSRALLQMGQILFISGSMYQNGRVVYAVYFTGEHFLQSRISFYIH